MAGYLKSKFDPMREKRSGGGYGYLKQTKTLEEEKKKKKKKLKDKYPNLANWMKD